MKFLDIDMDYFQTKVNFNADDTSVHWNNPDCDVWDEERFRKYLEKHLGLNKQKKVKGRIVTHHREVYDFADYLITNGVLSTPFDVIHIDAHLDMDATPSLERRRFLDSVMKEQKDLFQKGKLFLNSPNREYITSGSYLLAMALSQWTNDITYECPCSSCYNGRADYGCTQDMIQKSVGEFYIKRYGKIQGKYLEIHATSGVGEDFKFSWDYMAVAISPPYTVKQIRVLVEIIREYMEIV